MRPPARPISIPDLLARLPVVGAGAYAVALALSFGRVVNALAWNSDLVSPMVIADTVATVDGPHQVVFGTYAPYTSLWFNLLTRRLPFHRELWETAPLILSLLGLALLVAVSWRLAGRWGALVTLAVGLAWSGPVLVTLVAQADHGPAYFVMCLLAAFLVLVVARPRPLVATIAASVVVATVAGVNLASDPLLLAVGIAPLVGAPLLLALRTWSPGNRRALAVAGGAGVLAVVVALVTGRLMEAAGYEVLGVSADAGPLALAPVSGMLDNAGRLAGNLLRLWSVDFVGEGIGVATIARALLAGPALAVVVVPVVLLVRALRAASPAVPAAPAAPEAPEAPAADGDSSEQRMYLVFWGLVVGLLLGGSVFSRLAVENADRAVGYLTPIVLAVAATLPLAASRARWARWAGAGTRAAVGVGVAGLCALSTVDVRSAGTVVPGETRPYVIDGPDVLSTLEGLGLGRGYAAYASASAFTYQSGGRLVVRPVFPCLAGPDRPSLCGFFANRVDSWYVPQPGVRTFLLADPTLPAGVPMPPPAELGEPSEVVRVGSQTIYVYPYDVASRFGPTF